jgi:hypothetical protein
MLICIRYQHFTDRKDEEFMFDDVDVDEKRKTKDERRKTLTKDEKRRRSNRTVERRKLIQNKCVSSQNKQYEKRRGRYRSGYTYFPISAGCLTGRTGSVLPWSYPNHRETPLTTTNVLPLKRT